MSNIDEKITHAWVQYSDGVIDCVLVNEIQGFNPTHKEDFDKRKSYKIWWPSKCLLARKGLTTAKDGEQYYNGSILEIGDATLIDNPNSLVQKLRPKRDSAEQEKKKEREEARRTKRADNQKLKSAVNEKGDKVVRDQLDDFRKRCMSLEKENIELREKVQKYKKYKKEAAELREINRNFLMKSGKGLEVDSPSLRNPSSKLNSNNPVTGEEKLLAQSEKKGGDFICNNEGPSCSSAQSSHKYEETYNSTEAKDLVPQYKSFKFETPNIPTNSSQSTSTKSDPPEQFTENVTFGNNDDDNFNSAGPSSVRTWVPPVLNAEQRDAIYSAKDVSKLVKTIMPMVWTEAELSTRSLTGKQTNNTRNGTVKSQGTSLASPEKKRFVVETVMEELKRRKMSADVIAILMKKVPDFMRQKFSYHSGLKNKIGQKNEPE